MFFSLLNSVHKLHVWTQCIVLRDLQRERYNLKMFNDPPLPESATEKCFWVVIHSLKTFALQSSFLGKIHTYESCDTNVLCVPILLPDRNEYKRDFKLLFFFLTLQVVNGKHKLSISIDHIDLHHSELNPSTSLL